MRFLQRMAYRLQTFMIGRYGADPLSIALLVLGMIISLVCSLAGWIPWSFLAYLPYGFALYRMLSRKLDARRKENAVFLRVWNPIVDWVRFRREVLRNRNDRYFRCPHCGLRLRAPRGRGKIRVTCQRCHQQFEKKT